MIDRKTLRLSAVLLVVGFIFYVVVGLLHAGGPANNHPVVFAIYASSASWTAVHLGQFVGMAVIIAGASCPLLRSRPPCWRRGLGGAAGCRLCRGGTWALWRSAGGGWGRS
jgi:hypothetical protein